MKVLIVGGVAGGASAAARLRRLSEEAEIVLLERGAFISFANCALPYFIGDVVTDEEDLAVQTPKSFRKRFRVDVRTYNEVVAVNPQQKQVRVKNHHTGDVYEEGYDKLVLSPGAAPLRPPIPGAEDERVFVLRNIPDTMRIKNHVTGAGPRRAVVVGGGFIGLEMAENLAGMGVGVTIIEGAGHLLPPLDREMAVALHAYAEEKGIKLLLHRAVTEIVPHKDGLQVKTDTCATEADMVILSVGVVPDTAFLQGSGIALNARGGIVTDAQMRTNFEDVYAVGDAAEVEDYVTRQKAMVPLAGPANKQGRIVADNIAGLKSRYEGSLGSAIVKFFEMTVAVTGANEKALQRAGARYDKVYLTQSSHAGYYPGGTQMQLKVLFEVPTGRILGGQIVGFDGVDKRCDVLATAIWMGATADDLAALQLCYAPPFSSAKDPVNIAGYVMQNILAGRLRQFHWDAIEKLPRDGSVQLVDARDAEEFAAGHLEGFINIPLDELRENLHKLCKTKPVYIHCLGGLRSYIACRILTDHGYECHNMAGGWQMYRAVKRDIEKYGL